MFSDAEKINSKKPPFCLTITGHICPFTDEHKQLARGDFLIRSDAGTPPEKSLFYPYK
jgi:hypothetical protein